MAEAPTNLTPKKPNAREAFIAEMATKHGITKAHVAGILDRAFRHLNRPAAADPAADELVAAVSPEILPPTDAPR